MLNRWSTRRALAPLLVLVAASGVGLVACGDDGGNTSTSSTGSVSEPAAITDAAVERTEAGELSITWTGSEDAPVTEVLWGSDPDAVDTPLVDVITGVSSVTVADPSPGERPYFALATSGDERVIVAERGLPLEGDPNFRDLGGYETEDGRHVRWGRIYRSGSLDTMTDADLDYLGSAGIKLVCDLRSPGEVEIEPDRLPEGAEAISIPVFDDSVDPVAIRDAVVAGDVSSLGAPGELLTAGNADYVTEFTDEFSLLLERVMDPESQPTNLHCSAGKDRAGLGSAIVLLTLGVPEDVVMEDYLLSNEYRAEENDETLGQLEAILDADELEVMRSLLEVRPEYLQAALDAMVDEYGSIEAYLRDGLGITDDERAAFQELMLQ